MAKSNYPRKPRPKTRAELMERERQIWQELNSTWEGLPDHALTQPGACGAEWSIKDVMNHTAAWQEAALCVIPELLQGRKATAGYGVDKFNAIHFVGDKNLTLEESVRRFQQTRLDLLALMETLPDELLLDPNCRVGWWIKYSTYGHYSGHIHDLREFRRNFEV